jgi:hypothetical protein
MMCERVSGDFMPSTAVCQRKFSGIVPTENDSEVRLCVTGLRQLGKTNPWCRRGAWSDRLPSLILLRKIENPTDFINSGFRTESAEQTFGAQLVTIWTPDRLLTGGTFSQHRQIDFRLLR